MICCTPEMLKEAFLSDTLHSATFRMIGRAGGAAYRGLRNSGRLFSAVSRVARPVASGVAKGLEFAGDSIVKHPARALSIGGALAYGASTFPSRHERLYYNIIPEYPYIP